MTEFPVLEPSADMMEKPILDRILQIKDNLLVLKEDKTTYVKSNDVLDFYHQAIEQVQLLNDIREKHGKPLEQKIVDTALEDCFQLISLFFLTIGRNNEAPAVYSITSTVICLLGHLKEAAFYTAKDLESVRHTLNSMQDTLDRGKESYSPDFLILLENQLDTCRIVLGELQHSLAGLSPELAPIHERLVSILRSISAANTRQKFPRSEVQGLQNQLKEIQSTAVDGLFLAKDHSSPAGQEIVKGLLERCLRWAEIVLTRQGKIEERFINTYDELCEIRNQLEKLSLTQAWSLRETDLYDYQRRLDKFDASRINGNFEDGQGNRADLHTQRTLLYLIRRSYAYIYGLIISSEPVSEALLPVFNQLQTLKRCLVEVQRSGGVSSPRELYPYSMKLHSIDNMRIDGKFLMGSEIPEGQGSVNGLLIKCFELLNGLQIQAEEKITKNS